MRYSIGALLVGAFLIGSASRAEALALTPGDTTCTTNVNSNLNDAALYAQLESCFDVTAPSPLPLIYKRNVDDAFDTGSHATSYSTTFNADLSGGLIDYISGQVAYCTECYLVVKDGNQRPAQYFFDISGWNGTDDITLSGFWPDKGSISHISIHGIATDPPKEDPRVPEPASFLLISAGFGMAAMRLRKRTA